MSVPASSVQPSVQQMRRCIACGQLARKAELLRVVRRPDRGVEISARTHGRGAYVHRNADCLDEAAAGPKPLARALRQTPPPDVLRQIATQQSELTAANGATDIP